MAYTTNEEYNTPTITDLERERAKRDGWMSNGMLVAAAIGFLLGYAVGKVY
eukprot:CAMPEP_0184330640 /NCGR_PEP_ID=MMETSP1049-20130417/144791_1 /TAXON_ID=77928 /ORGANISM="Proteomonas sulcata, Strain CCMP704" /LENGTH=50 /DNA_ID=CAMNT_0026653089 /DNA_START=58 /DNA_END=210 /DNA_ORIENTATION=+